MKRCKTFSCKNVMSYIWNKEQKTFLNRTKKDWAKLFIFYLFFYFFTFGFTFVIIHLLECTKSSNPRPWLTGSYSALGIKPDLIMLPTPSNKGLVDFRGENITATKSQMNLLAKYSDEYFSKQFVKEELATCGEKHYARGSPCIHLRINKIFGWLPSLEDITKSMEILVECKPDKESDINNIEIRYYPNITKEQKLYGFFNTKYYPFLSQKDYFPPVLGVNFRFNKANVKVPIVCKFVNLLNARKKTLRFDIITSKVHDNYPKTSVAPMVSWSGTFPPLPTEELSAIEDKPTTKDLSSKTEDLSPTTVDPPSKTEENHSDH